MNKCEMCNRASIKKFTMMLDPKEETTRLTVYACSGHLKEVAHEIKEACKKLGLKMVFDL